jgi:hypothetical protein
VAVGAGVEPPTRNAGGGPAPAEHPAFDLHNPNKVYALLNTFGNNHVRFHAADGSGYRFLAEQIGQLDPLNPQVAARLARRFDRWRKFDAAGRQHARFWRSKACGQSTACHPTCARSSGEHWAEARIQHSPGRRRPAPGTRTSAQAQPGSGQIVLE